MKFESKRPEFHGKTKNTISGHDGRRVEGYGIVIVIPEAGADFQFTDKKHEDRYKNPKLNSIRDVFIEFLHTTDALFRDENDYDSPTQHRPYYRIGGRLSEHMVHIDMSAEGEGLEAELEQDAPYIWTSGRGTTWYPGSFWLPSHFMGFGLNIVQFPILRMQTLHLQGKELPTETVTHLKAGTVHAPPYSRGLDAKESSFISNTVSEYKD